MKVVGQTARNALQLTKVLSTLGCWFVFFYWGFQAFQKFLARPVSSSISVTNGDDGLSNLIFPALTICTGNFFHLENVLKPNKTKKSPYCKTNCNGLGIYYQDYLKCCTTFGKVRPKPSTTTTTTSTTFNDDDYFGGFGDIFDTDDEDPLAFLPFDTAADFMKATKLEIFDIIREFKYGEEIVVTKTFLSEKERKTYLKSLWIPTFDDNTGPCYTFDPSKQNVPLLPSATENIHNGNGVNRQQIFIEFSVRQNKL